MSIKWKKDKTGLISQCKLYTKCRKHYWDVYLWKDLDSIRHSTYVHEYPDLNGCFCPMPISIDTESGEYLPKPKVGEIHFIKNRWSIRVISHELLHAFFHRLKFLCPNHRTILEEDDMDKEEYLCYEFGYWIEHICRWLCKYDPSNENTEVRI